MDLFLNKQTLPSPNTIVVTSTTAITVSLRTAMILNMVRFKNNYYIKQTF